MYLMNVIECKCSHYEYDAKKIKQAYGGKPIDKLLGPGEHMGGMTHGVGWGARNYHPGKGAGENTDYGDGNLFFLEYLAGGGSSRRPFSIEHYVNTHWKKQYEGWNTGQCRGCKAWLDTMVRFVVAQRDKTVRAVQRMRPVCCALAAARNSGTRSRALLRECADAGRCCPTWSAASPSTRPAA